MKRIEPIERCFGYGIPYNPHEKGHEGKLALKIQDEYGKELDKLYNKINEIIDRLNEAVEPKEHKCINDGYGYCRWCQNPMGEPKEDMLHKYLIDRVNRCKIALEKILNTLAQPKDRISGISIDDYIEIRQRILDLAESALNPTPPDKTCPKKKYDMSGKEHTCGLNFYCKGCYDLGYAEGVIDGTGKVDKTTEE